MSARKTLPLTLDDPFGISAAPKGIGDLWSSQTELLFYSGSWKGDLQYPDTLEGMIDATKGGATFLFLTLDWKPIGDPSINETSVGRVCPPPAR